MKTKLSITFIFLLISQWTFAQDNNNPYSLGSLYAGYGPHGFNARVDLQISDRFLPYSSTRFYLEFGGQGITFERDDLIFENNSYLSDSRIISLGIGIGQEFHYASILNFIPFVGGRAEYVRFKDQDLVDGINGRGLNRYWGGTQVGPTVEQGYGDAITIDIGSRVGVKLTKRVELSGTVALSPIKFDTETSLFGLHWGEKPHTNPYYVERKPIRFEIGLRYLGRNN